jgi:hypothetical protein
MADLHALLAKVAAQHDVSDFAVLGRWHLLDDAGKAMAYAELASHELHLFLYLRDRPFFDQVVAPLLRNKARPQIIDRWLLAEDLSDSAHLDRLLAVNLLERILVAQRQPSLGPGVRRHVADLLAAVPPDPRAFERLLDIALGGSGAQGRAETVADTEMGDATAFMAMGAAGGARGSFGQRGKNVSARRELEVVAEAPAADMVAEPIAPQRFYRATRQPHMYAESNYYRLRLAEQDAGLLPVRSLWAELAAHDGLAGFRSGRVIEASASRTETLLALALTDLPFEPGVHQWQRGESLRLTLASPALVFDEQIEDVADARSDTPILLAQRLLAGDSVLDDAAELSPGRVYTCEVVVTNTDRHDRQVDVLIQIPSGAIPLAGYRSTWNERLHLAPYRSTSLSYDFYLPQPGLAVHHPATASVDDGVLARAQPRTYQVVAAGAAGDDWFSITQNGSVAQVLAALDQHPLHELDLSLLAWRLREAEAYQAIITALEARAAYQPQLWAYALHHDDRPRLRTLLARDQRLRQRLGPAYRGDLLEFDPLSMGELEHLAFRPLVNARRHRFGEHPATRNDDLSKHYRAHLERIIHRGAIDEEDRLSLCALFLLQDRVDEAAAVLAPLTGQQVAEAIQYDYCVAWLACARGDRDAAQLVCARYAEHPLPYWRERFAQMANYLDPGAEDGVDPIGEQSLAVTVAGAELLIDHRACTTAVVRAYPMDVEALFSRDPFIGIGQARGAKIAARWQQTVNLAADGGSQRFAIPSAWRDQDLLIEVAAGGLRRSVTRLSTALRVHVAEHAGRLSVQRRDDGDLLPGCYIKVYSRQRDGQVVFYKDGYSDLRGSFDYLALNTDELDASVELAILVSHPELGAKILRVPPPVR